MSRDGWREVVLGDVCDITDGAHSKVDRQDEGRLYLTSKNIKKGNLDLSKVDYINEVDFERLFPEKSKSGRRPKKGDLLIGIIGTFGNAYMYKATDSFGMSSSVGLIRPDSTKLDSLFLYYVIISRRFFKIIESYKSGSVQGYTNIPTLKKVPFNLPPLPTQKAIAKILGDLDAKIEINRKMNESLEAMAQALFQSWFVDFDPVIDNFLAKNNGNIDTLPEPLRTKGALRLEVNKKNTPEINELFPNNFVFNEVLEKWIPEGWGVKAAGDVCNITIGKTPPRKEKEWFEDNHSYKNKTWVSIKNMGSCGVYIDKSDENLTNEAVEKFNVKVVPKGTVILSFKMTVGRVAITSKELCTNEAIAHFTSPKFNISEIYLYNYLKEFNYDTLGSTSSIVTAVNSKIIKQMPMLLPRKENLKSFDGSVNSIFDKIHSISKQTQSLTKLRDTLLPQLISGKLSVPEAMLQQAT